MLRSGKTTITRDSSHSSGGSSRNGYIFAASWTEMVTGPVVDMVYDHYGLERTNTLFTKVCPGLRVGDFEPKVVLLLRQIWREDFELYARLKDERAQKEKRSLVY